MPSKTPNSLLTKAKRKAKVAWLKTTRPARRILRGWSRPTTEEAEMLNLLLMKKLAGPREEYTRIIDDYIRQYGLEGLFKGFEEAGRLQAEKRNEIASKIATKFALDAIGIGYSKKNGQARKKIHEITKRMSNFSFEARNGKMDKIELKNRIIRLVPEIRKEIGTLKTIIFLTHYCEVLFLKLKTHKPWEQAFKH